LEWVSFYGDGTCQPFRARLAVDSRQPLVLEIDPWTCAPVLRDEEDEF
jgi:general secretion pathway protein H